MFKFRLVMFDGRVDDRAGSPHDPEVQLVILQTLSDGTGTSSLPSASGRSDPDPRWRRWLMNASRSTDRTETLLCCSSSEPLRLPLENPVYTLTVNFRWTDIRHEALQTHLILCVCVCVCVCVFVSVCLCVCVCISHVSVQYPECTSPTLITPERGRGISCAKKMWKMMNDKTHTHTQLHGIVCVCVFQVLL